MISTGHRTNAGKGRGLAKEEGRVLCVLFMFGCAGSSLLLSLLSRCVSGGLSLLWLILLRSTGSGRAGSVAEAFGP